MRQSTTVIACLASCLLLAGTAQAQTQAQAQSRNPIKPAPGATAAGAYWRDLLPAPLDPEADRRVRELADSFRLDAEALQRPGNAHKAELLLSYRVQVQHEALLGLVRTRRLDPDIAAELPLQPGVATGALGEAHARKVRDWYESMLAPVPRAPQLVEIPPTTGLLVQPRSLPPALARYLKQKDSTAVVNPGYPSTPRVLGDLIAQLGQAPSGGPRLGIDNYWLSRRPNAFAPEGFLEVVGVHVKAGATTAARNCTGTLLDKRTLLTAAHCVKGAAAQTVSVRLQTRDAAQLAKCEEAMQRQVYIRCNGLKVLAVAEGGIRIHELYLQGQQKYDVALLELVQDVEDAVVASLSFALIVPKVTLAGFGQRNVVENADAIASDELAMRIEVGWHDGQLIHGPVSVAWPVVPLGAPGKPGASSGACSGDSGGPIYSGTQTGFASDTPMPHRVVAIVREGDSSACKDYVSTQTPLSDPAVAAWLCARLPGLPNIPCSDTKKLALVD